MKIDARVTKEVPRKLKTWTDVERGHFAMQLEGAPVRVHGLNGTYLFSISVTGEGQVVLMLDPKCTNHPQAGLSRLISWEYPLGKP